MADSDSLPTLKPLKSRRVPIQLSRKRSSNGSGATSSTPLSPTGTGHSEMVRAVEATAMAARDASARAELRKTRRATGQQSPLPPQASPKHDQPQQRRHTRKVSELDLELSSNSILVSVSRNSPSKAGSECKERSSPKAIFATQAGAAEEDTVRSIDQRHADELAELRAAHAAEEAAMIARHDAEMKASKSKRRKLTPHE